MNTPLPAPPVGYEVRVPLQEEATNLTAVGPDAFGRGCRLAVGAAEAWLAMRAAAEEEGVRLLLISGFRSRDRQEEIVRKKIELGLSIKIILRSVAYPGYSEHHTGKAVDWGSPDCRHLTEAFEKTSEFAWLRLHAHEFGFHLSYPRLNERDVTYEPWHWKWNESLSNKLPEATTSTRTPAAVAPVMPAFERASS
jgi:D-alanyl-D-alanine carboxypeptidase